VFRIAKKEFTVATRPLLFAQIAAAFGSAAALLLALPGVARATATNAIPTSPRDIAQVMKKADAWQLAHPWKPEDRNWIRATWYTGVMAAYAATRDEDYLRQSLAWAETSQWQPGNEASGANVLACGQTYLELWLLRHEAKRIEPLVAWLNSSATNTPRGARVWYLEGGRRYADSLFVAPPTLAMLARATSDHKYLHWMNAFYWDVYDELFDRAEGLFYRDERFIGAKNAKGRKVIWSRGNGWVFAGLPRILGNLPKDEPSRDRYEALFKTMAAAIAARQGRNGLWRPNLADPDEFSMPEASGTGFFIYGLSWGVQEGVLDRKTYLPVVEKAWVGLAGCVSEEGKVEWGQPVGDRPVAVRREDTHEYVTGAFLLAGSQVLRLATNGLIGEPPTAVKSTGSSQP
jgi:rhamnogalacturonyl hydrolase YesR